MTIYILKWAKKHEHWALKFLGSALAIEWVFGFEFKAPHNHIWNMHYADILAYTYVDRVWSDTRCLCHLSIRHRRHQYHLGFGYVRMWCTLWEPPDRAVEVVVLSYDGDTDLIRNTLPTKPVSNEHCVQQIMVQLRFQLLLPVFYMYIYIYLKSNTLGVEVEVCFFYYVCLFIIIAFLMQRSFLYVRLIEWTDKEQMQIAHLRAVKRRLCWILFFKFSLV